MDRMIPPNRAALRSALLTVLTLFGGILVSIGLGHVVFVSLPGHSMTNPTPQHIAIAAIPFVIGLLFAGGGWGIAMGRLAEIDDRRRMALAGILGFLPVTLIVAFGLLWLEPIVLANFGSRIPIHRVFTMLFVPAAFLIAAVSAWAIGMGLRDRTQAWLLSWKVGLAGGLTFLVVNLLMEWAGWVVGAPGAAERATMIVVMSVGNLAAALVAGGLLGSLIVREKRTSPSDSGSAAG